MIDSGTVRLVATANDMERTGLALVAYYLRLYTVERLLSAASNEKNEEEDGGRSEEVTAAATDLLDQIETFKQAAMSDEDPEAKGVKLLLSDQGKAMAYFLNFAMSLYNDKLSQVSSGPYDRTLRQGLWCCIDLFNAVMHLWSKELKDPTKIAERIKYCKIYLTKLAKGELKTKQTDKEQDAELDSELNKLIIQEGNKETAGENDLDYKDFLGDEIPGDDVEIDQAQTEPEQEVEPKDVQDLIEKLKLEEDDPPIEIPKKQSNRDDNCESTGISLPSAPASQPEYRNQPAFVDSDSDSESKGSVSPAVNDGLKKDADEESRSNVQINSPKDVLETENIHYTSNDLMAMMDRSSKIENIQRSAKYAISALNYEDIATARSELGKAMQLLDSL